METEFAGLVEAHRGLLLKVAGAYCDTAADREDLVQEIAVQLWRAFPRYDRSRRFSTWAYRIALNVAISYRRMRRRRTDRIVPHPVPEMPAPAAETGDDVEALHGSIRRLDAFDRALVLLYLDGYDHADVAGIMGISRSNVSTKLHRIKERLRRERARDGAKENAP